MYERRGTIKVNRGIEDDWVAKGVVNEECEWGYSVLYNE